MKKPEWRQVVPEEAQGTPFARYLAGKYEGEDPKVVYDVLEGLDEIYTIRGAAKAHKVSLEFVVKWSHTFLPSQVLRDIDHSDPFWRALLRLSEEYPESFLEFWDEEEADQLDLEEENAWALVFVGKPYLRGRVRSCPSVKKALAAEEAHQASMEASEAETLSKATDAERSRRDLYELRNYALRNLPKAMATLLEKYINGRNSVTAEGVIEKIISAAEAESFKVRHSPSRHAPCPLCRGVASDPRAKGYALPAGLLMHLKGEGKASPCQVLKSAMGLARDAEESRTAWSRRLAEVQAEAETETRAEAEIPAETDKATESTTASDVPINPKEVLEPMTVTRSIPRTSFQTGATFLEPRPNQLETWLIEPFDAELELWTLGTNDGFYWLVAGAAADSKRCRKLARAKGISELKKNWDNVVLAGSVGGSFIEVEIIKTIIAITGQREPIDTTESADLLTRVCEQIKRLHFLGGTEYFERRSFETPSVLELLGMGLEPGPL